LVVTLASSRGAAASGQGPATCVPHSWPAIDLDGPTSPPPDQTRQRLASASAALRATCARIEAANKRHLIDVYMASPEPYAGSHQEKRAAILSSDMGCAPGKAASSGAWVVELGAFTGRGIVGNAASVRVEHVTPEGRVVGAAKDVLARDELASIEEAPGESDNDVGIAGTFDFDGDGVDEVLVQKRGIGAIDGFYRSQTPHAYRFTGGAVVPWQPVPGRETVEWRDVDHDDRPDIVLATRTDIDELAHSLAEGAFSTNDAIAQAYVHALCVRTPRGTPTVSPALGGMVPDRVRLPHGPIADALCAPSLAIDAACPRTGPRDGGDARDAP
jgi:hypothetical protein